MLVMLSACTGENAQHDPTLHNPHHTLSTQLGGHSFHPPNTTPDVFLATSENAEQEIQTRSDVCRALTAEPTLTITLMFGLKRPHGVDITPHEWQDFVETTIMPRFPSGLSVLPVEGQWQDRVTGKIGQEPSRFVLIAAPASTPHLAQKLTDIRSSYQRRFNQQAVGVTITPSCSAF